MIRVLKSLLLWLLIAALPIQGLAAVMRATCSQSHHMTGISMSHATPISLNEHVHGDESEHADHLHEHHHSGAHQDEYPPVAGNMSDDASSASDDKQVKSSTCSACATCCVGAVAPPSALLHIPHPDFSSLSIVGPLSRMAGYIPPSLERPPRLSFV